MVKTGCYLVYYWKESCTCGAVGSETMLGFGNWEGVELGKKQSLQHLGRRAEERDGTVTARLGGGFIGFWYGDD